MSHGARLLIFGIMALGMFMALLDIQIVAASLPEITSGLAAGADQGSWIQTSYLIAEIVMIPLSAILSQRFSTRWVFTASAAAFTLASVACGLAGSLESAVFFRAVQGFVGGAMIPTVFATGYALFEGPQRALIPAILGLTGTLAPVVGPSLGGYITDLLSWRWLFFINVVPGILITLLVPIYGKIDDPDPHALRGVDIVAVPLLALFLGGIIYVLEEGPRYDWFSDETNLRVAMLAFSSGALFFWRSLTHPRPVVNLSVFRSRAFSIGAMFQFIVGLGIFTPIYLVPQFLAEVRGFRSLDIGRAVAITGVAQLFGTPLAATLSQKMSARAMLAVGFPLFALSCWLCAQVTSEWGAVEFALPQAVRGFSLMFCIVPATNLCLGALPPSLLKAGSGLSNLMRNLGGALGIALANTLLNDRFRQHFLQLGEHLTPDREAVLAATGAVAERAAAAGLDPQAAMRVLAAAVTREARTLAFADCFVLLEALFLLGLLLLPLTPVVQPPPPGAAAEH